MNYEWDEKKRAANLAKHGVDFMDASVALQDPANMTIEDPDAVGEERWVTLGMDWALRVLVVIWTERADGCIRIISARKASPAESRRYNGA
ncbi:MAG: BrnT family toxin [Proteobacteria bacterium]|nr:BrnT family toxin [Pseudomonadota bacterium]MCL2306774.1 BrnT family toxin [Pseudomonadota bacterium]